MLTTRSAPAASTTVQRIDEWLKMNADKAQLLWFGTRQQLDKLQLLSARVSFSTTVSDLAVFSDSQLSVSESDYVT